MATFQRITPCLWFDEEAETAVNHYASIFDNSRIARVSRYHKGRHKPEGTVLTMVFQLAGREFMALNGGPDFKFTEAVSMVVACETRDEIDRYWDALLAGGTPIECGWLKDKFGLSWQIVPAALSEMLETGGESASRVVSAVLDMVKLDIAALRRAYDGT